MKTVSPLDIQDFATENHNLIYSFLHSRNLKVGEWYDVAAIGFMKAIHNYNTDKGKFSVFAYKCMENEISMEKRKFIAEKRIGDNILTYYDTPVVGHNSIESTTIQELIEDFHSKDFENEIAIREILKKVYNNFSLKCKSIIYLNLKGYNQPEIAKEVNLTQSYVSRVLKQFFKELIEEINR